MCCWPKSAVTEPVTLRDPQFYVRIFVSPNDGECAANHATSHLLQPPSYRQFTSNQHPASRDIRIADITQRQVVAIQPVRRATHTVPATIQNVRVGHGLPDVLVSKQLLDGSIGRRRCRRGKSGTSPQLCQTDAFHGAPKLRQFHSSRADTNITKFASVRHAEAPFRFWPTIQFHSFSPTIHTDLFTGKAKAHAGMGKRKIGCP